LAVVDCGLTLACFLLFLPSGMSSTSRSPSPSSRPPERRIHRRVPVGTAAWVVVDEQRFSAECVNVSMGGAAVRTDARPRTGSVVRLELSLGTDGGTCSIKCEVVRTNQADLGLRFMALDRASLEAILSLL
jgi:hypothetical protein